MTTAQAWLNTFEEAARNGDTTKIVSMFHEDGFWRDYLPFGWDLQTLEGHKAIGDFANEFAQIAQFTNPLMEGQSEDFEGFFRFETRDGPGRGHIRLKNGRCYTFFTLLENLRYKPESNAKDLDVLIVGGGQAGLTLGAQLSDLGVSYLIVDKYPKVGDQWRSRYDSLVLHDPVWYDHLPFKPFPKDWPVFTPKDTMGDWLEAYAEDLDLNVWNATTFKTADFDAKTNRWNAWVEKECTEHELKPKHLVMALGLSGFANVPTFQGQNAFKGTQIHSSAYRDGRKFKGQKVIVVGANNSAHDIAADLFVNGAKPTLLQRSTSLVVRQSDYCQRLLGPLFSQEAVDKGITTDKADILQASVPLRLMEQNHRKIWDQIKDDQSDFYSALSKSGFALDFAEDGAGLGLKYRRTASGYYIDVGASQMVVDGQIEICSGQSISHLSHDSLHLEDGTSLNADAIIYATGYGNMIDWVEKYLGESTANQVGPCWGYGSSTKGDPGPWIGELRNMWKPTKQTGLWFMAGNLSQVRFFSRILALQLAKA